MSRLKYVVPPEVEEVRHVASLLDGRVRWPRDVTEACVRKLRKAGLVPAAIADRPDERGRAARWLPRLTLAAVVVVGCAWMSFQGNMGPLVEPIRKLKTNPTMLAISADSRQAVDQMTEAAGAQGGKADVNPRQDHGFMYGRSFQDLDGHVWEPMFVDMSQFPKG